MTQAVFITGGAKRIGKAIAIAFAEAGWAVALHYYQSQTEAEALAAGLPTPACVVSADLAQLKPADATRLLDEAEKKLACPITCLINNASLFENDDATALGETLLEKHLAINLKAPLFLSQAMAAKKNDGSIIMLLDQKVLRPTPDFFSYTLSKMALWDSTKLLASRFAPTLRVHGVAPGPILPSKHQTQAAFDESVEALPLRKSATAQDIAAACLFLAGLEAASGQILALDGGQHLA